MDKGILLDSGTNELEILEFRVGPNYYGINVAKVKEILSYRPLTPIPKADRRVEGVFMPRDELISIIDLAEVLDLPKSPDITKDMFIETNFNKINTGFHVHEILGINRFYWTDMRKPDPSVGDKGMEMAVGIVDIKGHLVIILDFEKIMSEINPEISLKMSDIEHKKNRSRDESPIIIAEDSDLLRKMITDCLVHSGYTNVTPTNDGQECWDLLKSFEADNSIKENVACVITDIEMPRMDGHHLTKLIKDDEAFADIPVVIFSSIVNDSMIKKGESIGANAQISKPDIGKLVDTIDDLLR